MTNARKNNLHSALLVLGLLVLVYTYFWGYGRYRYLVPPGDDSLRHMTQAQEIAKTGVLADPVEKARSGNLVPDPPLFHILLASLSEITGIDTVTVVQFLGRFIAILAPFAAYFLARKLFRTRTIALLAFLLLAFFSPQPLEIFNEGNYPNIIGAHVFMVFGLSFLPGIITGRWGTSIVRPLALSTIFFIAVFIGHPVSAIYVTLILAGLVLVYFVQGVGLKRFSTFWNVVTLLLMTMVIAVPFIWNYYAGDFVNKGITLMRAVLSGQSIAEASDALNFIPAVLRAPASFGTYMGFIGPALFAVSVGGVLLLLFRKNWTPKAFFILWVVLLALGSQTSFFQLPYRFARDLFLPLALAGGFFIYSVASRFQGKTFRAPLVAGIAILFVSQMLFGPTNFAGAVQYNGSVRLQGVDGKALQWIREYTTVDDVFLGSPLVSTAWGSYVTLLTDRQVLDGLYCGAHQPDYIVARCDVIYQPESLESLRYYYDNDIDYVFAGHPPLCCLIWKNEVDWDFHKTLSGAAFLDRVFASNEKNVGSVSMYKVNKERLLEMLTERERVDVPTTAQPST